MLITIRNHKKQINQLLIHKKSEQKHNKAHEFKILFIKNYN